MSTLRSFKRISRNFQLYATTIRYLRWPQIWRRILPRGPYRAVRSFATLRLRAMDSSWVTPVAKPAKIIDGQFSFGGQSHPMKAHDIWHNKTNGRLWLYQLHYFDDLTNSHLSFWQKHQLITRWIDENPYSAQSVAWEPYPLSIRLVNWCKWLLTEQRHDRHILHSIAQQADVLNQRLEYHLLGNHLLMNAKALIFAGCILENQQSDRWLNKGTKIFNKQLVEQLLPDGGHMERSPMYHASVLEDILDVYNILQAYNGSYSARSIIGERVLSMLNWLQHMIHPDGGLVYFNDTVDCLAPTYQQLYQYALKLGLLSEYEPRESGNSQYFSHTGYAHIHTQALDGFIDIAPLGPNYLPGHAHADTLCFELSVHGERLLVNQGIATYEKNQQRLGERGTQAHNTVMVDDMNSSQVWSGFRVGRRAKPMNIQIDLDSHPLTITAQHDGYQRQGLGVIHQRRWLFNHNELIIHDCIEARDQHNIQVLFHVHPHAQLSARNHYIYDFTLPGGSRGQIILDPQLQVKLESYQFHPSFGYNLIGTRLNGYYHGYMPLYLTHRVISHADTVFN